MTSSTFEELWEKLDNARKSYAILIEQSEASEKPITMQSNRLNVLKGNLEEILQKAEDDLFDQWEYDEIVCTAISLLNAINSALYPAIATPSFELEKDRLIDEGADPKLFDIFIVEKLLTELIQNPHYGKVINSSGKPELIRVNEDGTFNIETLNIDGHAMTRYENGDIELYKVEITAHENRVGEEVQVKYKKRNIDRIVFDKNGVIIEQSTFSTFKHGFL